MRELYKNLYQCIELFKRQVVTLFLYNMNTNTTNSTQALAIVLVAILGLSIVAVQNAFAPAGGRGIPSAVANNVAFYIWPNTEQGLIKTASGATEQNTDMAFAFAPVGQPLKSYVILKADPNRVAETAEISVSADGKGITAQWWETNVALNPSDPAYTIPFRMTSIDGGLTWNAPQNIADLPDAPAKIIPVGAN